MRISESDLRKIIRRELKRSLNEIGGAYSAPENTALPYTPNFDKNEFVNIWNSSVMDWALTAVGAVTDFIPAGGTGVSVGVSMIQAFKAYQAQDWLSMFFSLVSAIPAVGDALAILGRAVKAKILVDKKIITALLKALTSVLDGKIQDQVIDFVNWLTRSGYQLNDTNQIIVKNVLWAKKSFENSLKQALAQAPIALAGAGQQGAPAARPMM
jgi:hypothetical protein